MSGDSSPALKAEIGHVLLLDIVGYSKLLITQQGELLQILKELVQGTAAVQSAPHLLRLATGDGMALAAAEEAIQAAFRLRPDAGEAHLARAENLYRGYLDYDAALAELEIARRKLPNNSRVLELAGYINRRRGKNEEGLRSLEGTLDLDPRNILLLQQMAGSYFNLRRYPLSTLIGKLTPSRYTR